MPTDLFTTVQFNDGEGLDFVDFNDIGRGAVLRQTDQFLSQLVGRLAAGNADPDHVGEAGSNAALTSLAYTMTGGDCAIAQGSTSTRVKLLPGLLFQKTGNTTGTEGTFLPYSVQAGDVDLTIAAGDATHPRVDIVQARLEWVSGGAVARDFMDATTGAITSTTPNKTRRVQATFSVKAGTPAATPTYPTPDAGYVLVAAVRVPAGWASGFRTDALVPTSGTAAVLVQNTIPLRVEAVTVMPHQFEGYYASNWARAATGSGSVSGHWEATGAGSNLLVWIPGSQTRRVVGVALVGESTANLTAKLVTRSWKYNDGLGGAAQLNVGAAMDLTSKVNGLAASGLAFAHLGDIADASSASNPTAAAGPIGDPFWAHGGISGPAYRWLETGLPLVPFDSADVGNHGIAQMGALELGSTASGCSVAAVTFFLAG
ncbi:MAG TPA: hypothetical protein VEB66_18040 [Opitutaceae bacterium]|nr:hypothetical protein [Opitutaceae bacterium]